MSSKTTKEEKEDDNHKYIYMYMMADIDARTGRKNRDIGP